MALSGDFEYYWLYLGTLNIIDFNRGLEDIIGFIRGLGILLALSGELGYYWLYLGTLDIIGFIRGL